MKVVYLALVALVFTTSNAMAYAEYGVLSSKDESRLVRGAIVGTAACAAGMVAIQVARPQTGFIGMGASCVAAGTLGGMAGSATVDLQEAIEESELFGED